MDTNKALEIIEYYENMGKEVDNSLKQFCDGVVAGIRMSYGLNGYFTKYVPDLPVRGIVKQSEKFTDSQNRCWHVLERECGRIIVYYTMLDSDVDSFVVYDSLGFSDKDAWDESHPKTQVAEKIFGYNTK